MIVSGKECVCPPNTYRYGRKPYCWACSPSCTNCGGENANECTTCESEFADPINGVCSCPVD